MAPTKKDPNKGKRPDYNPDREGHVEKVFIVQDATTTHQEGVETSKGYLEFNKQGRMVIKDESLAREVQREYPSTVAVTRTRRPERGHNYFFGGWPEMPWKRQATQEGNDDGKQQGD